MHIEKLGVGTLLPIILSEDGLQFVMLGQTKKRVAKNSYSLEQKGFNEIS